MLQAPERIILRSMRRCTQDFTKEGVHVVGAGPACLGAGSPPDGSRGKVPVGDLGDEVSQKLKQNVKFFA